MKYKHLPNQSATVGPRSVLLCVVCGETCSAHSGDYFMADPESIIEHCGEPMELVNWSTIYTEVEELYENTRA